MIRPVAVGRKNRLFAGSLRVGQRVASILSLLVTAKDNGLDPYSWLRDVDAGRLMGACMLMRDLLRNLARPKKSWRCQMRRAKAV